MLHTYPPQFCPEPCRRHRQPKHYISKPDTSKPFNPLGHRPNQTLGGACALASADIRAGMGRGSGNLGNIPEAEAALTCGGPGGSEARGFSRGGRSSREAARQVVVTGRRPAPADPPSLRDRGYRAGRTVVASSFLFPRDPGAWVEEPHYRKCTRDSALRVSVRVRMRVCACVCA